MWQHSCHCLRLLSLLALIAVKLGHGSKPCPTLCGEILTEVDIHQLKPVDFVVFDVAESVSDIDVLLKRSGDSLADVIHGSGSCMAQPFIEPIRASTKLACPGPY